ncbi:MAG: DoxX family membrane protein [Bacteroidota bacterium]
MSAKIFMAVRILLGVFVLVFGLNKFLHFLPDFELNEAGQNYFGALVASHTMTMVALVEIVAGLALVFNKWGSLMTLILMSVSVCAVLFHATLDPANIGGALVLLVLNIVTLLGYKDRYADILRA